ALGYFENNAPRMRYHWFRSRGLFVGSGAVEAGCKAVIGQRLKLSGMRWTIAGAHAITTLRCQQASRPEDRIWPPPHNQTPAA
ncbi:MAG: ISKra4 family transposase, partial [Streptosporangiaceae bacterium]